jgi:hypothetical protein
MKQRPMAASKRRLSLTLAHGVGVLFLLVAATALAFEVMAFAQTGSYRMVPSGELWFMIHVGSLNLIQAITQRYIHPALWDPVIAALLQWPAWSLLGAPGIVLAYGLPTGRRV